MKKQTVIIPGIVLFLLLALVCLVIHVRQIERKLTAQASESIRASGIQGVDVSFSGRDATLTGTVDAIENIEKAAFLTGGIEGVRSVTNILTAKMTSTDAAMAVQDTTAEEEPAVSLQDLLSELEVYFDTNRVEPVAGSGTLVSKAAGLLKKYSEENIELAGHADSRGSAEYNRTLSLRRAESVKRILTEKGIPADRLVPKGYGETKPIADNATSEGMAKNRRVELIVIEEE